MSLLEVRNGQNELILNTPNRAEILKAGPPHNSKCTILGKGAYGTVFKAIFRDKPVAVKVMKNANAMNLEAIKNEAHIIGWQHRNIVKIMKVESTPNFGIVIMERICGQSLKEVLDKIELTLPHRINISLDILSGLTYCHRRKLLHLDVKPQNIYVSFVKCDEFESIVKKPKSTNRQYICKLCDFGSSLRLIEQDQENYCTKGIVRGTIRYMSPEMIRGVMLGPSSDIYSLGITMWQMQTRQMPYHWIECNEVVAYQVTKHNLRPDAVVKLEEQHEFVSQTYKHCYKQFSSHSPSHTNVRQEFQLIRRRWPLQQLDLTLLAPTLHSIETLSDDMNLVSNVFNFPANIFQNVDKEAAYRAIYQLCWLSEPSVRPNSQDLYRSLKRLL